MAQKKLRFNRTSKHSGKPARRGANKGSGGASFLGALANPNPAYKLFLLTLTFVIAAILTAAGFFFDSVPFALAYTPFLMALITPSRWYQAALVGGHFAIVFDIAATGLVHMGFSGWSVGLGFLLAVTSLSGIFAVFGVGLAAVILLFIPYFPGNPLLITGTLYPGFGVFGIVLLSVACIAVAYWKTSWARLAAVLLTIVLPALAVHSLGKNGFFPIAQNRAPQTASGSKASATANPFESIALNRSSDTDITGTDLLPWRLLLALRDLPEGSVVITGENLLTAKDDTGQRLLCRMARAQELDLYVGVASVDGTGEIWRLGADTCPDGTRVYRASIGIPGLTGAFWPDVTNLGAPVNLPAALDGIGFLACFEAFTLHRWIAMGLGDFENIVIVSNDQWTDPLPVTLLRTKVSDQFARLFGMGVVHAGRNQNILILKRETQIAEEKTGGN